MTLPGGAAPAHQTRALAERLSAPEPLLALAPMQDVTDLPFWTLLAARGGPDVYWTEYFRVHATWRPESWILRSLVENPTGRPAIAQLIGNDARALAAAAKELARHPVAAIDLNLGCPAPIVYRKCAGGGLLRDLPRIDGILAALRDATGEAGVAFTVKTRIGFSDAESYPRLLEIFHRHGPDLVTVHARTVADGYRAAPRFAFVRRAVESLPCPVLANGNVGGPDDARSVLGATGARGVMIGRGCVRNPWIFEQIRESLAGRPVRLPAGRAVLAYVEDLWRATEPPDSRERLQVEQMKRCMNFIGAGVGRSAAESASFLHRIRRAASRTEFFGICREHLDHDEPTPLAAWTDALPAESTAFA